MAPQPLSRIEMEDVMSDAETRVPFPVPDFDGPTVIFGAPGSAYLTREQMGDDFYFYRRGNRYTSAASSLFFSGGKLADHGLRFKPEIDTAKAKAAVQALLCSFEPKHEVKIGTVGYALREWCDVIADPSS